MSSPSASKIATASPSTLANASPRLLERLGLHRPALRAWVLYDWANSAVVTTIIAAIFPIYFYNVVGRELPPGIATRRFALANAAAMLTLALAAPILGAIADLLPVKKRLLGFFVAIGSVAAAAMFGIHAGDWRPALALFALVTFSVSATFIFYDALLPHLAEKDEMDRVSTTGYALGYLGGGLLLACNLAWITRPEWFGFAHGGVLTEAEATLPTRLALLSAAVWWALFSAPLLLCVREPSLPKVAGHEIGARVAVRLRDFAPMLKEFPGATWMLIAFLVYNEGIGTIIRLAAIYGAELGLSAPAMIGSILIVQFTGIPCTIAFGMLATRIGAKRSIYLGLAVYLAITALAYYMTSATQFLLLALLVGAVQGGTQALSRSLFASLMPPERSAEFFAIFALGEKLAGMAGPALFVAVSSLTGSSRHGIASVLFFFVVGGLLLRKVRPTANGSCASSLVQD
jgi:UMF1 family MFS transporter